MMQSITFECEVITPMFLAGADGVTPELRPPSIKGALRFWWRALNGHLPLTDVKDESGEIIQKGLKTREGELFGDTNQRSKVLIRVGYNQLKTSTNEFNKTFISYKGSSKRYSGYRTNAMYYLGYGLTDYDKVKKTHFNRHYITPKNNFTVKIKVSHYYKEEILKAFKALEQFGGLGSRSRNGFGCFRVINTYIDEQEIKTEKIQISDFNKVGLSSYTAFSKKTNVFTTKEHLNWEDAFKDLAVAYQYARENIDYWHEWEWRELIAQPIIVKGEGRSEKDNPLKRHSKPYFIHISKYVEKYIGQILLLPYSYIEGNDSFSQKSIENNKLDYFDALDKFNNLLAKKLNHPINCKIA